ncbi:cytochrome bo3 quinol oxidase subunit 2 [Sphingomonas sp. PP-CE-3A-406]|uniref:ubiquinol oxidase subunit II n=1 Tax=Sphingomonas sp. PP-CE-3A-406 TaxID=2135659 RepID=UPI000EF92EEC|nr:ubiquinol oxidase subunit II [Sphingomonas sp. PP-CE-3A-406]RMB54878.1 cytochrome bo3 quinol oxidase subunit 2 [Sphingomonas sp. PP-CE-3A-406]
MKRKRRHLVSLPVLLACLGGCTALSHGFLNPQGPVAGHERDLFFTVSIVLLFVAGPVLLLTPLFAWHYRLSNRSDAYRPKWNFSWWVEALIWIPPAGIVIGLAVLLWHWTQIDDPYRRLPGAAPVEVQAIALDWKWVFVYPDLGVASVDRLTIPAGRPVHIKLTSGTVMQSMLIPQLAGQIYTMGGMTTELNIQAHRPGRFRGENTQYNGAGFQHQKFDVVAVSPAEYDRWAAAARRGKRTLDAQTWRRLSARSIITHPVEFAHVTPNLFDHVVAATGGMTHAPAPHSSPKAVR